MKDQVLALLNVVYNTEGKVTHPGLERHAVKVGLPQFTDNGQQDAHEFFYGNSSRATFTKSSKDCFIITEI